MWRDREGSQGDGISAKEAKAAIGINRTAPNFAAVMLIGFLPPRRTVP
jgi:hypothetical protein